MNKLIISIFAFCASVFLTGCRNSDVGNNSVVCKCFISGMVNDGYDNCLIEVMKDGKLYAYTGTENRVLYKMLYVNSNMTKMRNPFLSKISQKREVSLTDEDIRKVEKSVSNLKNFRYANPFVVSDIYDSWTGIVVVGDRQYVFYKLRNGQKELRDLVQILDSLSPIPLRYRNNRTIY